MAKCPNCGNTAQIQETENGFICGCGHEWVYCPCNGWDCLYWKNNGTCGLVDEGYDPAEHCADFF